MADDIALSPKTPQSGRLAILSALSLAASAIPIPFLPDRVVVQIRGAIVHDLAGRHGVSLTTEGRAALAEASTENPMSDLFKRGLGLLSKTFVKKLSPLTAFFTASSAVEVFALGHLFDRYLELHRGSRSVRMSAEEARAVRKLIEGAVVKAFSPSLQAEALPTLPPVEDLRDEFTRWADTLLLAGAGLPSYLERRLNAAFDAAIAEGGAPAA